MEWCGRMNCAPASLMELLRFANVDRREFHAKSEDVMNKERIEGSFDQAKGKVKEGIGKATGDAKLEGEGKADQVAGKVKNTIGGAKDAIKEAVDE